MTHEFKQITEDYLKAVENGYKTVLATVVKLDGSSYRRPGVRMLISESGAMTGAVSGGCVEKEVLNQSQSVLKDGKSKLMTYDGRYRLGCEGTLYILIEAFAPGEDFIIKFRETLENREAFKIHSFYSTDENSAVKMGSVCEFSDGSELPFTPAFAKAKTASEEANVFSQKLKPRFRLLILGAEHDAVALCRTAASLGWEVNVVAPPRQEKTEDHFPGINKLLHQTPEELETESLDKETAVLFMNHNYALDLNFLTKIKDSRPAYIGLLGPTKRREKLLNEFSNFHPDVDFDFVDLIHGPTGLHIGAETADEIAVSITAEILSTLRQTVPIPLKEKNGKIHS